ncbi:tripartite tricarboxylate transporter substrate binding protein [Polaromonas sp. P1-6]|nr:tripartite tricarboxylate transporter substrate binding protein [Polaromonas sp. P1-6]
MPFAPAGPNDLLGRTVGERIGNATGRTVLVDNKAGAASIIAADYVARSRPDGNTLLLATQATLAANPALYKTLPYDPVKSFKAVALLSQQPPILVVPSTSAATSASQLIDLVRRSPTAFSYASAGNGTVHHLAAELLKSTENLQMIHVPYKGSGPALMDLVVGRVQLMFVDLSSAAPFIKSGALRPLLVAGPKRMKGLPGVPTAAEAGLRSLSLSAWAVLLAPAGTPAETIDTLNRETNAAIRTLSSDDRFVKAGIELRGDLSASQVTDFIKTERPVWEQIIRRSGATAE